MKKPFLKFLVVLNSRKSNMILRKRMENKNSIRFFSTWIKDGKKENQSMDKDKCSVIEM